MDIRSSGARSTRRLTQAPASRQRSTGAIQSAARGGDAPSYERGASGLLSMQAVPPRSARQGYVLARRMQEE